MVIQKEVEGTSFDSAFQTGNASLMTLDQYIGNVKSGEYASRIAYLRGLIKAGKKDEADAYKTAPLCRRRRDGGRPQT